MASDIPITENVVYIVVSAVGATAWLTWFIRDQFSKNRRDFYRVMSRHNKEDDDRFAALQDNQYELREYIARRDGTELPQRKTFPRRRYLIETPDENEDDLGQAARS